MLGKSEWFERRKYGGWGLRPATWQGWFYVLVILIPVLIVSSISGLSDYQRNIILGAWIALILVDSLDIMMHLRKDERSRMHEAISERNSAWFMVIVLTAGFAYRLIQGANSGELHIDPIIATALFGAVIIKGVSNYILERKN